MTQIIKIFLPRVVLPSNERGGRIKTHVYPLFLLINLNVFLERDCFLIHIHL